MGQKSNENIYDIVHVANKELIFGCTLHIICIIDVYWWLHRCVSLHLVEVEVHDSSRLVLGCDCEDGHGWMPPHHVCGTTGLGWRLHGVVDEHGHSLAPSLCSYCTYYSVQGSELSWHAYGALAHVYYKDYYGDT